MAKRDSDEARFVVQRRQMKGFAWVQCADFTTLAAAHDCARSAAAEYGRTPHGPRHIRVVRYQPVRGMSWRDGKKVVAKSEGR